MHWHVNCLSENEKGRQCLVMEISTPSTSCFSSIFLLTSLLPCLLCFLPLLSVSSAFCPSSPGSAAHSYGDFLGETRIQT